jgi:hypothetical protein
MLIGAGVLWPSSVHAAPGDATRLEYARSERAAACPDRSALKAAVSKRLGYDPFFPAARQTIVVEIIDLDGALRAQMRLVDDNGMIVGSRELREKIEHCDELVASLALAISIALDPSAALGEASGVATKADHAAPVSEEPLPEPTLESVAQEHPPKPSQTRQPMAAAPTQETLDRFQVGIRSALFADTGTAPALAFGWRVGLDLRRSWYRFAADFSQQLPTSKELAEGGQARASLLAGSLAPCVANDTLAGCGLLKFGALQTRGEEIAYSSSQSTFYAALGARFEYTPTVLGKLQLLTQFDVLKPLTPVSLRVLGEEVWHSPSLTFAVGVGVRLHFQ